MNLGGVRGSTLAGVSATAVASESLRRKLRMKLTSRRASRRRRSNCIAHASRSGCASARASLFPKYPSAGAEKSQEPKRVMNLTLIDAFGRFGAKPESRLGSLSAMAADGAMVLNCLPAHFGHPTRGVLRYETRLSTAQAESKVVTALGVHLTRAREESLPVRMVVTYAEREKTS